MRGCLVRRLRIFILKEICACGSTDTYLRAQACGRRTTGLDSRKGDSMAERVTTYQCPSCTGPLHYDGQTGRLVCDYCGSSYTLEEVTAFYESRNEAAAEADHKAEEKERKEAAEQAAAAEAGASGAAGAQDGQAAKEAGGASGKQAGETSGGSWGKDAVRMRAYNCTTCGAELLCDDTMAAFNCPYCGNATIIPGRFDGTGRPDHVLPFKISREQALDTLKGYYKGKHLLPSSFASANHLEEIKGVYVPFRMYSGTVDAQATYTAKKEVEKVRREDTEIVRTEIYEAERSGALDYTRIPVDASKQMPDDLMDSIEPFDYGELKPFAFEYMPGFLANREDMPQKELQERAHKRAGATAQAALKDTVKGFDTVITEDHSEKFRGDRVEYGLLPVWLLSTRWDGKTFLFAMNGQTGKMVGDLPISNLKMLLSAGGTFLGLFLLNCFLLFAKHPQRMLLSILLPAIAALIVTLVLRAPMKNVATRTGAADYVVKGDLHLGRHTERYVRTEEQRRQISSGKKPAGGSGGPGGGPGGPGGGSGGHGGGSGGHGGPGSGSGGHGGSSAGPAGGRKPGGRPGGPAGGRKPGGR